MSLQKKYGDMVEKLISVQVDLDKLVVKNNKMAGVRVRNMLMEVKKMSHSLRLDILKRIKEIGVKKKTIK